MAVDSSKKRKRRKKYPAGSFNTYKIVEDLTGDVSFEDLVNKIDEVIEDETSILVSEENSSLEEEIVKEQPEEKLEVAPEESSKKVEEIAEEKSEKIATIPENAHEEPIKPKKKKLGLLLIILLLLVIGYLVYPKIILNGEENTEISYKDKYLEPGYKAKIFFFDVSKSVKTSGNIKEGTIGEYKIDYYIKYSFLKFKKVRTIKIVDNIKPTIEIEKEEINICPNKEIPDIEFKAYDEYDGDLTDKVLSNKTEEKIVLTVTDNSLNEETKEIKITRGDTEAPVITLKGDATMYITYGLRYNEPGYSAIDNCDDDLTDKVSVSGSVGSGVGTYKLTYTVSDKAENKGTAERTVIVVSANRYNVGSQDSGVIYLTFDDGPSEGTTNYILDVLKEEGVKATFFVTCNGPDYLIKRMSDEGHTVALHTASHDYAYIYSSVDNYFNDLNKVSDRVKRITGNDSKIIRFPGGSSNTVSRSYKTGIMSVLTGMVLDKGYHYFDWNVDSNDAGGAGSSDDVFYNVVAGLSHSKQNVVLMHDIKWTTRGAIRNIIKYGKDNGYTFKNITMDTYMIRHSVQN